MVGRLKQGEVELHRAVDAVQQIDTVAVVVVAGRRVVVVVLHFGRRGRESPKHERRLLGTARRGRDAGECTGQGYVVIIV